MQTTRLRMIMGTCKRNQIAVVMLLVYLLPLSQPQSNTFSIIQSPRSTNVTLEAGESGFLSFLVNNSNIMPPTVRIKITKYYKNGSDSGDKFFQRIDSSFNGSLRLHDTIRIGYTSSLWPTSNNGREYVEYVIRVVHGENFANVKRLSIQLQVRDDQSNIIAPTSIAYHVIFSRPTSTTEIPPVPTSTTEIPPVPTSTTEIPPVPTSTTEIPPVPTSTTEIPPVPTSTTEIPPVPTSTTEIPPVPTSTTEIPPVPTSTTEIPPVPTSTTEIPPVPTSTTKIPPVPTSTTGLPPYLTSHCTTGSASTSSVPNISSSTVLILLIGSLLIMTTCCFSCKSKKVTSKED